MGGRRSFIRGAGVGILAWTFAAGLSGVIGVGVVGCTNPSPVTEDEAAGATFVDGTLERLDEDLSLTPTASTREVTSNSPSLTTQDWSTTIERRDYPGGATGRVCKNRGGFPTRRACNIVQRPQPKRSERLPRTGSGSREPDQSLVNPDEEALVDNCQGNGRCAGPVSQHFRNSTHRSTACLRVAAGDSEAYCDGWNDQIAADKAWIVNLGCGECIGL